MKKTLKLDKMIYTFNLYWKSAQTYWKPCTHTFSPSVISKCLRIRAQVFTYFAISHTENDSLCISLTFTKNPMQSMKPIWIFSSKLLHACHWYFTVVFFLQILLELGYVSFHAITVQGGITTSETIWNI